MPQSAHGQRGRTLSGLSRLRRRAIVEGRWPAEPPRRPAGRPEPAAGETALDELLEAGQVEPEEVAAAAAAEAAVSDEDAYGRIGPPIDRRSPFWIGMSGTFGVAVAALLILMIYYARGVLLLLGLSLFIAAGLDPMVAWLHRRMPRPLAVLLVILLGLLLTAGVADLVVPVLVREITALVNALPHYFKELNDKSSFIGRFNDRYHVERTIGDALTKRSSSIATGILGVGRAVLGALASTVVVMVVSIYLLFDMPRFKRLIYGLAPRSRRARTVLLGDQIFAKVGGYLLGNIVISVVTGLGTWVWCVIFGVPFPLLLAVLVALFDLVPVVGSTIGGIIVAGVSLTVSLPVAIATVGFYLLYRFLEDYLLAPRIMRRTVDVPGLVTVVATLIGGVLLGIIGALVAIPVAAAVKLLLEELAAPRLEQR